ncbi:MAG TPA: hypothetical protein VIG97_01160 [Luteimonas sp.]
MAAFHASLLLFFLVLAALFPGCARAGEDIVRTNGSVSTTAGAGYGRLATTNGSIRLDDGVTADRATTTNGSISAGNDVTVGRVKTVNGAIRLGERVRVEGAVQTVNGSIFIDRGGQVGEVETTNGAIGLVATRVAGDVSLANGDLTIGVGSHVRGSVHVRKPGSSWMPVRVGTRLPRVVIGPGAVVDGPLVFERDVVLHVHESARIGPVTGAEPQRYSTPTAPERGDD